MRRVLRLLAAAGAALALWAAEPSNDFHFSILGDRTGRARQAIYAQTWVEIDKYRPAFVINVGDTIQGTDDETAAAQWTEIRAFLNQYQRYPFFMVAGNHDVWNEYSQRLFEEHAGRPATYSFDFQNAHFVVLNNSRDALFGIEQLRFLEDDLRKNRDRRPKFVFFHQPFWLLFLKAGNHAFPLHTLAREYGLDYVISGHGHQFARMVRDGVTYMEVGSSGAYIGDVWKNDASFALGAFYHHVQVQVSGTEAKFTVKELDAPYGKGRSFEAADWSENGGLTRTGEPSASQRKR
jgi:predicted phosphodiesterase